MARSKSDLCSRALCHHIWGRHCMLLDDAIRARCPFYVTTQDFYRKAFRAEAINLVRHGKRSAEMQAELTGAKKGDIYDPCGDEATS